MNKHLRVFLISMFNVEQLRVLLLTQGAYHSKLLVQYFDEQEYLFPALWPSYDIEKLDDIWGIS